MVTEAGLRQDIKPKALVISRPDSLYDVVLASVVLAPVRAVLPKTRIFLLVDEKFAALFVNHPQLDGIFTIAPDTTAESLANNFKKQKIDALAHLEFSPLVSAAAKLAGIRYTSAFETEDGGDASLEILDSENHRESHAAFHNFEVLAPFGVSEPTRPKIDLSVHADAEREAFEKLRKYDVEPGTDYAVFCLDSNQAGHEIHASVFARTAGWISRNSPMPILVLGDPEKSKNFLKFCISSHGAHILDFRGKTTPAEDAWLIKSARFCFSGENAHAYLAAATACPLIALFVDFSAGRWFPLGHLSTNIFTGAHRFPFEPRWLYNLRASRTFQISKIASALKFSLALKS